MGGSAPSAPSFGGTFGESQQLAALQLQANEQAQQASQVGQFNPAGTIQYTQTGTGINGVPLYTGVTQLSPGENDIFNKGEQTRSQAANIGQQLMSQWDNNMVTGTSPTDVVGNMTSGLTGQQMNSYAKGLQPFFNLQNEQAAASAMNMGAAPGSTAWYSDILPVATGQASALSTAEAQFQPSAFNEAMSLYQVAPQMALTLDQYGQPVTPGSMAAPTASLQPTNQIGAFQGVGNFNTQVYQGQLQAYAQQQAILAALIGAGGKLAGGLMMGGGA